MSISEWDSTIHFLIHENGEINPNVLTKLLQQLHNELQELKQELANVNVEDTEFDAELESDMK